MRTALTAAAPMSSGPMGSLIRSAGIIRDSRTLLLEHQDAEMGRHETWRAISPHLLVFSESPPMPPPSQHWLDAPLTAPYRWTMMAAIALSAWYWFAKSKRDPALLPVYIGAL